MAQLNPPGINEFPGGQEDWEGAARQAEKCRDFKVDVEDELVADEPRSCYNCRYRRWTAVSFCCTKSR